MFQTGGEGWVHDRSNGTQILGWNCMEPAQSDTISVCEHEYTAEV
jgi:hypothetical protein